MPIDIDDEDEFTDPITRPAGGDPRTSDAWGRGHQELSNRTRFLKNRLGVLNSWTEIDASALDTTYRVVLPPTTAGGRWVLAGGDGSNADIRTTKHGRTLDTPSSIPGAPATRYLAGIISEPRYILGSESGHIITASTSSPNGTWTQRTSGVESANKVRAFAQNADGSVVVAITDHASTNGILRSTDHGLTWSSVDPGASAAGVDVVWTGTKFLATFTGGATRTSTDGSSWSAGTALPITGVTTLATDGDGTVIAYSLTSATNLYKSTDHGATWSSAQALSHEHGGAAITGDRGRMIWHDGVWILAFGGQLGILSSPTALAATWRAHVVEGTADLVGGQFWALAYGEGRYIAGGGNPGASTGFVAWLSRTLCTAQGRRGFPEA